ncbi:WhiB family transcriptional regulator [Corynebacterium glutamicum]|uniref:WhiB family transcriptional regulator n=1 Tax=Corynebacterium glutamicum TaxID=1718 RepID=UPI001B8B2B68
MARSPSESLSEFIALLATDDFRGAACAGQSPYLFDGAIEGEPVKSRRARHQRALKICSHCPIKQRCRDRHEQIPRHYRHGVWGGIVYSR